MMNATVRTGPRARLAIARVCQVCIRARHAFACAVLSAGCVLLSSGCQSDRPVPDAAASEPAAPPAFPQGWQGSWAGTLTTYGGANSQRFTMKLDIRPAATEGRWTWIITYDGDQGSQVRNYELVPRDPAKGLWEIDERNGIVIPARWLNGVLYTDFEVQGNRISTREELVMDRSSPSIHVEMRTLLDSTATKSGGGQVPEVTSLVPQSAQMGVLRPVRASR